MDTNKTASSELDRYQLSAFPGFPYLITRIAPSLYHINLLPLDERYGFFRLRAIARRQADANRLRACLVLERDKCLYLEPDGREAPSAQIPWGGYLEHDKLVLCEPLPETEGLALRSESLELFASRDKPKEGNRFILGDLSKGGRCPTEEENRRLRRRQENGVPVGLNRCPACGNWRGECFDTLNTHLIVRVCCVCQNDTLCAGCRCLFGEKRLESNFYSEGDGTVWHVPAFAALTHRCKILDGGHTSTFCKPLRTR